MTATRSSAASSRRRSSSLLRAEVDRLGEALALDGHDWGSQVDWERDHLEGAAARDLGNVAIARIEPLIDLSDAFAALSRDPR